MKLIKPSFEILHQKSDLKGIYKMIELAGRTCYKSENKITEDSTDKFINMLIDKGHTAMLEHGTVYLIFKNPCQKRDHLTIHKYMSNPYSKVNIEENEFEGFTYYITTNYRVLYENDWLDDLKYLCEPTKHHEKRVTVKFTSNIHFYKDVTRHRKMSYAIESTRWCNYSLGKFNNELTFIMPQWIDLEEGRYSVGHDFIKSHFIHHLDSGTRIFPETKKELGIFNFIHGLIVDEAKYLRAIEKYGWRAEEAAELLPQATKADIVITGFISDWKYIFDVRADGITGIPHPEVMRLMRSAKEEFIKRNWI